MQGAENTLLLEAMAAECLRLEPDANMLLADGDWLRNAHATGSLAEIAKADLLLLHQMDSLNGPARGAMRLLIRERMEKSLLTVLAFQATTAWRQSEESAAKRSQEARAIHRSAAPECTSIEDLLDSVSILDSLDCRVRPCFAGSPRCPPYPAPQAVAENPSPEGPERSEGGAKAP